MAGELFFRVAWEKATVSKGAKKKQQKKLFFLDLVTEICHKREKFPSNYHQICFHNYMRLTLQDYTNR